MGTTGISSATRLSRRTPALDWHTFTVYYTTKVAERGLDNRGDLEMMCRVAGHDGEGKGLFLFGGVGNGKTTRLRFIADVMGIAYTDARTLAMQCAGLHRRSGEFLELCNCQQYGTILGDKYHRKHDLIIDDLGTEAGRQASFGNTADVMAAVIDARWDEWEREGWRTFFATNLPVPMLKQAYGERTFSRLAGMCEFIALPGGDRRAQR